MFINIRMNKWYKIKDQHSFFLKTISCFFRQKTNALHIKRKIYKSTEDVGVVIYNDKQRVNCSYKTLCAVVFAINERLKCNA